MEKYTCKFCGKALTHVPRFSNPEPGGYSCPECGSYCMHSCLIVKTGTLSWHEEPCVSCEHNPYRLRYEWNGEKWQEKD